MEVTLTNPAGPAAHGSGRLVRSTLFNLAGLGVPLVLAFAAIPALVHLLGVPRFGLLTLIWAVVSYFGLFDLGLGRALTQRLAQKLATEPGSDLAPTVGTALITMGLVGAAAGVAMAILSPLCLRWVHGIPDADEASRALVAMAFAVPAVVLASGLRGILEARQAFGVVNLIRVPLGAYTFLAPWLVAVLVGPRLDLISLALLVGRVAALAAHAWAAARVMPSGRLELVWRSHEVRPLLTTGGWLTVGNLVGPLMGYADRFIIAATVSASAVAYYATPNELVTKLWIVPGALTAVLFPAFAQTAPGGGQRSSALALRGIEWLFVVLLPLTLSLALFAHELLDTWVGAAVAAHSAPVLRVLALGIMINCLAHVPLTLLQGAGKVRAPAVLQVVELGPYLLLLWWASGAFGVVGTATVWSVRMAFDTSAMFALCADLFVDGGLRRIGVRLAAPGLFAAAAFGASFAGLPLAARTGLWLACCAVTTLSLHPWRAEPTFASGPDGEGR